MIQTQVEAIIRGPPKYYFNPFFKQANVEKILSRKSESEPRDLISQEQELEPTEKDRYSNTAAQTIYIY